ncbi:MAG: efflux RND transporter periplasmic adaptor subunit [Vicinamibacteria bacterium]
MTEPLFPKRLHSFVFLAALIGASAACDKGPAKAAPSPAIPVTTAVAQQADFPIELRAIGSVESPWNVEVKSQVEGAIQSVHFHEGDDVRAGQLLFTIDPRPYEAALAVAEANLARDKVQALNAERELKRAADLFAQGLIATDVNDRAAATSNALNAGLKADEAAVQNARLRLDYCSIRSPLNGRTGSIMVKVGNMVRSLDTVSLVNILQIDPITVRFSVPEARLSEIRKAGTLPVTVLRRGEENDPSQGTLTFLDQEIDRTTGNIKLKARFANAERKLWPGQFVDVVMVLSTRAAAVTIPTASVQDGQAGPFVFVVTADKKVESRPVQIGPARLGLTLIEKGIASGETVVVDGQVRLTEGATVDAKASEPKS